MSFGEKPTVSSKAQWGCLAYGLVGAAIVATMLTGAAMGDCAPNENGAGCENDAIVKFAMFPGSLIIFIIGGIFLAWRVTRDKD